MAPRRDLLVAALAAALLMVLAFLTGRAGRASDDPDPRASAFLTGREGARALFDASERLGVQAVRWRRRPQALDSAWGGREATLTVLAPSTPLSAADRDVIVRWPSHPRGGGLIVAGTSARPLMRCFGFRVVSSVLDSARVVVPGAPGASRAPGVPTGADEPLWVHARLARDSSAPPASRGGRDEAVPCPAPQVTAIDTVLRDDGGAPVLVRLTVAPWRRPVFLAADDALVRNRSLRRARAGAAVAAALIPRSGALVFDEYHHGLAPGGSMAGVTLAWSTRHPLGWMAWQLAVVGLLALGAGALRFGPVRAAIPRRRREGREHVRALATALGAAAGHREAVGALVRGLRRRLAPGGTASAGVTRAPVGRGNAVDGRDALGGRDDMPGRDDWRPWLASLARRVPSPEARRAAERLLQLADDPRGEAAVAEAAHAADAVWAALRPAASPSTRPSTRPA